MVHLLLRRGKEKHIRSFLEKGEMCFNTMESFRNVEKEEFAKKKMVEMIHMKELSLENIMVMLK